MGTVRSMGGAVLTALIFIGLGVVAEVLRRRWDARRRPEAHHRALETMGRLAAQQSPGHTEVAPDARSAQAHVRLVHSEPVPGLEPVAPRLRSSRPAAPHEPAYSSWIEVEDPLETVALTTPAVTASAVAPAAQQAVGPEAPGRPLTRFDAGAAPSARRFAVAVKAGAGRLAERGRRDRALRGRRDRAPRGRRDSAPRGWSRPGRLFPRPGRLRLGVPAIAGLAVLVLVAGTIGGIEIAGHHSGSVAAPPRRVAALPPARPVQAQTPAPVVPATPVLVTSASGYSEYRTSESAAIVVSATGTCWVEIRQAGPTGPLLYEGDMVAGGTKDTAGPIWIRLGDPTKVTVTVNGDAIAAPGLVAGDPYNLEFD